MTASTGDRVAASLFGKHPLQRLPSPSRELSALVHLVGLASFASSYKFLIDNPTSINDSYGWHLQYLTIIGLTLATLTFILGLVADITLSRHVFLAKNAFSVASAPLEFLISILYWSLRVIDPQLVVPDWLPPLPLVADIGFHAAPAILLVLDLLFLSPPWTISAAPAMALSTALAFGYWFWVEQCYSVNGFYPYPIFDVPVPFRIALFTMSAVVMSVNTFVLKWLYSRINGSIRAPISRPGSVKRD